MNMGKKIAVLSIFGLLLVSGVATGEDIKIGFVNVGRLISESPQGTAAMEALQEEFAPRQREIIALQDEFQEREARVERDLEVMGAEERRNAELDLRKQERNLTRSQQEFTEDINLRRNEALGKLQRELLRQVQVFAGEAGYDLVVSDGVLYASESIDVTELVLEGLKTSFGQEQTAN